MAWIESHQELGNHPKLKKLCRVLTISQPQAVGHLQFLWWWSLDYCDDGDLSRFDALDIAIGAMWDGDPTEFLNALVLCGWIDFDHDVRTIHDWDEYIGRLLERRRKDAERKRTARGVHGTSSGHPDDGAQTADVTLPYPTVPNQTEPNPTVTPPVSPPAGDAKPKAARKTQIPVSWIPDQAGRDYAIGRGIPPELVDDQVQRFKNFHAGKGNLFADIPHAWRTWADNYQSMNRGNVTPMNRGPGSGPYGRMTPADHVAAARESEERDRRQSIGAQT
jgi:hypothetical protein